MSPDLVPAMQRGVAVRAVPRSAAASRFCASLDLGQFAERHGGPFLSRLEASTEKLMNLLPPAGRSWGAARSILNQFLREALYNRYLCDQYHLERAEEWLELPLDSRRVSRLRSDRPAVGLEPWRGVRSLTSATNTRYQAVAAEIAEEKGLARVHLDAIWWRGE